jgi:putative ABC transport system permease protein
MGNALGMELFLRPLDFVFALNGVFLWGAGIFALAILASLLPAQNAARLTIRDTLAYEG